MCSIISEVASLSTKLIESAIIIYAFAVEIFGLERKLFSETVINLFRKKNPKMAEILTKIGSYLD